jgi:hypothetical protein
MKLWRFSLVCVLATILPALFLPGCGGSGNSHTLQSVSISPSAATSRGQFDATGFYNTMPTSVDITATTTWCIGNSDGVCDGETAGQVQLVAGSAQCLEGASGSFLVLAGQAGPEVGVNAAFTLKPFGWAQITCP